MCSHFYCECVLCWNRCNYTHPSLAMCVCVCMCALLKQVHLHPPLLSNVCVCALLKQVHLHPPLPSSHAASAWFAVRQLLFHMHSPCNCVSCLMLWCFHATGWLSAFPSAALPSRACVWVVCQNITPCSVCSLQIPYSILQIQTWCTHLQPSPHVRVGCVSKHNTL